MSFRSTYDAWMAVEVVLMVVGLWCGSDVRTLVRAQLDRNGCDLTRIPVQQNFNITRFAGKWRELLWVAPFKERFYDATDYYWQLQVPTGGSHQHMGLHGYQSGRDKASGRCFGARITLNETSTPGVFLFTTPVYDYTTRYYIMDTDYDTYANAYGCYDYSNDGTRCYKGRAWLWARGSNLPMNVRRRVLTSWQRLCLDLEALLKVTAVLGNDCSNHGG